MCGFRYSFHLLAIATFEGPYQLRAFYFTADLQNVREFVKS